MDANAQLGDLGGPPVQAKKLPTKPAKVVPKKGKAKAKPLELEPPEPDEGEEERRSNAMGIEGLENTHLAFLKEYQAHKAQVGRLRLQWANKVKTAREAGIKTRHVLRLARELGEEADVLIEDHNVMNQLRELVFLPHFERKELLASITGEARRDKLAETEGRRCSWRGGREQDCPYPADQPRYQHWVRGYREEDGRARAFVSSTTMKHIGSF